MNLITIDLEQIKEKLTDSINKDHIFTDTVTKLSNLLTVLDGLPSNNKLMALSKAFWEGLLYEVVPRQQTDEMNYYKTEWEVFKLSIMDNGHSYSFNSQDIIF